MIKQITEKSIEHRVRFHLFYSPVRWLFFEVDKMPKNIEGLADFIDNFKRNNNYPRGIYTFETVIENKIFEIEYSETEITEEKVIDFAKTMGL